VCPVESYPRKEPRKINEKTGDLKTKKTVSDQINARDSVVGLIPLLGRTHWFMTRITLPIHGFKAFHSAAVTLAWTDTAHIIGKGPTSLNSYFSTGSIIESIEGCSTANQDFATEPFETASKHCKM
jgi:hypothetical protein